MLDDASLARRAAALGALERGKDNVLPLEAAIDELCAARTVADGTSP